MTYAADRDRGRQRSIKPFTMATSTSPTSQRRRQQVQFLEAIHSARLSRQLPDRRRRRPGQRRRLRQQLLRGSHVYDPNGTDGRTRSRTSRNDRRPDWRRGRFSRQGLRRQRRRGSAAPRGSPRIIQLRRRIPQLRTARRQPVLRGRRRSVDDHVYVDEGRPGQSSSTPPAIRSVARSARASSAVDRPGRGLGTLVSRTRATARSRHFGPRRSRRSRDGQSACDRQRQLAPGPATRPTSRSPPPAITPSSPRPCR